jgi:hypothetical protein
MNLAKMLMLIGNVFFNIPKGPKVNRDVLEEMSGSLTAVDQNKVK